MVGVNERPLVAEETSPLTLPQLTIEEIIGSIARYFKIPTEALTSVTNQSQKLHIKDQEVSLVELRRYIAVSIDDYRNVEDLPPSIEDIERQLDMMPGTGLTEMDIVRSAPGLPKTRKILAALDKIILAAVKQKDTDILISAKKKKKARATLRAAVRKEKAAAKLHISRREEAIAGLLTGIMKEAAAELMSDTPDKCFSQEPANTQPPLANVDYRQKRLDRLFGKAPPETRKVLTALIDEGFDTFGAIVADPALQPFGLHPKRVYELLSTNIGSPTYRTAMKTLSGVALPESTGQQMARRVTSATAERAERLAAAQARKPQKSAKPTALAVPPLR